MPRLEFEALEQDANALSSLRKLWQERKTKQSLSKEQEDDEEEDYASDEFWLEVEANIESASHRYYNPQGHHRPKQEIEDGTKSSKKNQKDSKGNAFRLYGLHTSVRLIVNLLAMMRGEENDDGDNQRDTDFGKALLSFALCKYRQDVSVRDPHGRLPLHVAVQGNYAGKTSTSATSSGVPACSVISSLLELHPEAAQFTDPNEQTDETELSYSLHSALMNGYTWHDGGVKELVENFDDALVQVHDETGMYPYQMAAISNGNLDTIYRLLRTEPGVLQNEDEQEEDLGLMVISMHDLRDDEDKSQVLMYLTSDDECSFGEPSSPMNDRNMEDEDAKVRIMQDGDYKNRISDTSSVSSDDSHSQARRQRRKRRGRRRSFVSFDDQAKILEQAAEVYQRRKENGFRDLGLLQHIDNCKNTRAQLNHIGDPEILRKKKIADFIEEFRRTKPRGKQTHGLSEFEVKERRANLRKVPESPTKDQKTPESDPPVSPIAKMKSNLRSADAPRPIPSPTRAGGGKKWVPPTKSSDKGIAPVSPINFMFGGLSPKKKTTTEVLGPRAQYTATVVAPPPINNGIEKKFESTDTRLASLFEAQENYDSEDEEIEQGPLSPMQKQRKKLRSVRRTMATSPKQQKNSAPQEEVSSPYKQQFQQLRPTQTKVPTMETSPQQKKVSAPPEEVSSPYKQQFQRLRPTQTKLPTMETSPQQKKVSAPPEEVSSPYKQQFQRLRPTQTKPRTYQSSIKNIESYERSKSTNSAKSTLPRSESGLDEKDLQERDGSYESGSSSIAINVVDQRASTSILSDPSAPVLPFATSDRTEMHETSDDANLPTSSRAQSEVPCQIEIQEMQDTESTPGFQQQSCPVGDVEKRQSLSSTTAGSSLCNKDAFETVKSTAHKRRITADCVLRKRAEMEIRDRIRKTHKSVNQYRERRLQKSKHNTDVLQRREQRLERISLQASLAQESIAERVFDQVVYKAAVTNATETESELDEATHNIEAELVKQMHCMLTLERQEALTRQGLSKTVTYLRRCIKWLQDFDMVATSLKDLEAQNIAMIALYESTVQAQEKYLFDTH